MFCRIHHLMWQADARARGFSLGAKADPAVESGCSTENSSKAEAMSTERGLAAALGILLLASMMGCSNHEPVPAPVAERTQAPKQLYKLTMSLPEELGSTQIKRARANYSIENRTCVPMDYTMALGGHRPHFTERIAIDFRRTGDAEYTGYLYGDAFVSADYYALGICTWKLEGVDVLLDIKHDVSLIVGGQWILAGEGTQSSVCPRNGHPSLAIWGCLAPTAIAPSDHSDYFEVIVKTEKER